MDGYSVQEAASVLGVAEGRVWELLARGVILGTPEGDSMRVFLKAQPGPIAATGTRNEPRTNGNGGSHAPEGEASAFRELLTEFRNLTERYGQALLALGEARGEVAGLRSRVDQLEARFDLRLSPPLEVTPVAWESTTTSAAPPVTPPQEPPVVPLRAAVPPPAIRRGPRSRKARSAREATASFADALARAVDPSAADLGPGPADSDVIEAVVEVEVPSPHPAEPTVDLAGVPDVDDEAVLPGDDADLIDEAIAVQQVAAEAVAAEPESEPMDLEPVAVEPVAVEPEPIAIEPTVVQEPAAEAASEAEPPTYSAVVVEPDWFADGDFAWLDAAEHEPPAAAQSAVVAPTEVDAEPTGPLVEDIPPQAAEDLPVPAALEAPELVAEHELVEEPQLETLVEPVAMADAEAVPDPLLGERELSLPPLPDPVPVTVVETETTYRPWGSPELGGADAYAPDEPAAAGDAPGPSDRSTAHGADAAVVGSAVAVQDLEEEVMWLGADPAPVPRDEPPEAIVGIVETWPVVDTPPTPIEASRPPLAMTEDELARLALDEGWDEAEVAAIRAMITPLPSAMVDLPGAAELHEAMAALEAVPVRVDPAYDTRRQWAKPISQDHGPAGHDDWVFGAEPASPAPENPRPPTDVTAALRRSVTDPGWLRRRQGPAAAAYRRLRRLLPG